MGSAFVQVASPRSITEPRHIVVQNPDVFTHEEAGVQFQLPKGWKAKPDGEVITASSADDALQVGFWVPDEDTFEAAVRELDKEISKTVKNMKTTEKPAQDTLNGMAHYGEVGCGEVNGAAIDGIVYVLRVARSLSR